MTPEPQYFLGNQPKHFHSLCFGRKRKNMKTWPKLKLLRCMCLGQQADVMRLGRLQHRAPEKRWISMRNSLAGVVVLLHFCIWFPFSARQMGASDALSVSTGCPALWTDLGREHHLPKHPPATHQNGELLLCFSSLICSAVKH